jgi:hypothetical protein
LELLRSKSKIGNFSDFVSLNTNDISFRSSVGIAFNEEENALYIASIGKFHIRMTAPNGAPLPEPTPWGYPFTGVIWKVTAKETGAAAIEGEGNTTTTTITNETAAANTSIGNMTSNGTETTLGQSEFTLGVPRDSEDADNNGNEEETATRESSSE